METGNAVSKINSIDALAPLAEQARDYINASKAANTLRAYRTDWNHFETWCEDHGLLSLPATPDTIALYISDLAASRKPSTINRKLAAISIAHQARGYEPPTRSAMVRETLKGIRRTKGILPQRKTPIRAVHLRQIADQFPDSLRGTRDCALLFLGYAGAFRRSELIALNFEDIEFTPLGLEITLRRSKTDQEGKGQIKVIGKGARPNTCPVRALESWIRRANINEGPLFISINRHGQVQPTRLTSQSVSLIIKNLADKLGLPSGAIGGHSLRAGFVTDAKDQGIPDVVIMKQTGHRTPYMINTYYRGGDRELYNTTSLVGL